MTTIIRLFGKNIEVEEKEQQKKSVKLFGKNIIVTLQEEEEEEEPQQQVAPLILQQQEEEPQQQVAPLTLQEEEQEEQEEPEQQVAPLILQEEEEEEALIQRDLPPPNMCEAIRLIGGSRPVYVCQKKVEDSDVNHLLSRFLFPTGTNNEEILKYLSSREIETLEIYKSLEVRVMDPKGRFHAMKFTRWSSLRKIVFNKGWNKLVSTNKLQKGDIVDLWHFRISSQLRFAINIIRN